MSFCLERPRYSGRTKAELSRETCGLEETAGLCGDYTVLASGGIGGLFKHSTNYPHLTGDALAFALKLAKVERNMFFSRL